MNTMFLTGGRFLEQIPATPAIQNMKKKNENKATASEPKKPK